MLLGTSKIIITPQEKVRLAGYATRETVFEDVLEDIYVRVYWLSNAKLNTDEIVIYGDLIWFGEDFVEVSTKEILNQFPCLTEHNIYFIASHNHSGPPTGDSFIPLLETYDERYALFLRQQVLTAVQEAYGNREVVRMERYRDCIALNVYRRVMLNNQIEMRPNYNRSSNQEINLIVFRNAIDQVKGIMVHYPCHANISNENHIAPDFPGVVLRKLDEKYLSSISIFLQGATADLRPNVVLGNQFVPLGFDYVVKFADMLFNKIESMLINGDPQHLQGEPFSSKSVKVRLPQEMRGVHKEMLMGADDFDLARKQWLVKVKRKSFRLYEDLKIRILFFGSQVPLFFFNAELSQSYEEFLKACFPNALAVSYANGMIGYVSDDEQILEGGYEPVGSTIYFALSGSYKHGTEKLIKEKILELKGGSDEKGISYPEV